MRGLLLVDPQTDFISGSLPVPGAGPIMDNLARWLEENSSRYVLKLVTLDFHPYDHSSFADCGGGWPRHCVAFSEGAAIWPSLIRPLCSGPGHFEALRKGMLKEKEEYSIFQNPEARERVLALAGEYGVDIFDICGIAGDVCVLNTLKDGIELMGKGRFNLLEQFTPSLDGGTALREFLDRQNASDNTALH